MIKILIWLNGDSWWNSNNIYIFELKNYFSNLPFDACVLINQRDIERTRDQFRRIDFARSRRSKPRGNENFMRIRGMVESIPRRNSGPNPCRRVWIFHEKLSKSRFASKQSSSRRLASRNHFNYKCARVSITSLLVPHKKDGTEMGTIW